MKGVQGARVCVGVRQCGGLWRVLQGVRECVYKVFGVKNEVCDVQVCDVQVCRIQQVSPKCVSV